MVNAASFASSLDRFVTPPLLYAIARHFEASLSDAAAVASAYFLLYGLLQLFWGMLSDRLGRVRLMRLCLLGAAAFGLLSALAPALWLLVVLRALTGGLIGAIIPTSLVYVGDTVAVERRQAALAGLLGANALAITVATLGAGLAASLLSWRVAFLVPAIVAALVALGLGRLPEPPALERGSPIAQLGLVVRRPWALLVIGLVFVEGGVMWGGLTFLPAALESQGASAGVAGLAVASFGVAAFGFTRVLKAVLGSLRPAALIALGSAMFAAAYGLAAARVGVAAILVAAALVAGGYSFMHSSLQAWATDVVPEARASTISLFASGLFVGSAVATQLAGGWAAQGDFAAVFTVMAFVAVPLGIVATIGRSRYPTSEPVTPSR